MQIRLNTTLTWKKYLEGFCLFLGMGCLILIIGLPFIYGFLPSMDIRIQQRDAVLSE
jgi:hypothetical protein